MAGEKFEIIKEKLDHTGIFDFAKFYSYAHSWLKERKYDITEEKYSEKLSDSKRDISIEWKATKKMSDYFKFEIAIRFDVKGLSDVEVEIEEERKKMNKGSVSMEFKGALNRDPEGKWDTSPWLRFVKDFYNKFVIPSRIKEMEGILASNVVGLKDDLKAFLELTGKR